MLKRNFVSGVRYLKPHSVVPRRSFHRSFVWNQKEFELTEEYINQITKPDEKNYHDSEDRFLSSLERSDSAGPNPKTLSLSDLLNEEGVVKHQDKHSFGEASVGTTQDVLKEILDNFKATEAVPTGQFLSPESESVADDYNNFMEEFKVSSSKGADDLPSPFKKIGATKSAVFSEANDLSQNRSAKKETDFLALDAYAEALEPAPKKESFIMINPQRILDKRRERELYKSSNETKESKVPTLNLFDIAKHKQMSVSSKLDIESVFEAIELVKPESAELHSKQFDEVVSNLSQAFTKDQLKKYVASNPHSKGVTSFNKKKLSEYILRDLWKVKKLEVVSDVKELIREESIQLSARDLRLLLSNSGVAILNWRSLGADISIDRAQRLVVKAPMGLIRYIRVVISNMLEGTKSEALDLTEFHVAKNKKFLDHLSSITDVVLERTGSLFYLYSLKERNIVLYKQLLASSLSISPNIKAEFLGCATDEKFEVNDTVSIPEIYNYKKWFRSEASKTRKRSDDEIFDDTMEYETISKDIDELMLEQLMLEPQLEEIKQTALKKNIKEDIEIYRREESNANSVAGVEDPIVENDLAKIAESAGVSDDIAENTISINSAEPDISSSVAMSIDVDEAFGKLSKLDFVTATLGSILVDDLDVNRIFIPHVSSANKVIQSLPLYNNDSLKDHDCFDYLYVIKLIPNPYKNFESLTQYPAIEFWFEPSGSFIDIKTLKIFQTKSETSLHYSLPNNVCDLKIYSTQLDEIHTNFNKTEWLADQPGVLKFLEDSQLRAQNFKLSTMPESCKIRFGKEMVDYYVVGNQQRRQLELKYKNQLLQYNIIENGIYGGKNLEVNLIGNLNGDMDKNGFKKLISSSLQFIESL